MFGKKSPSPIGEGLAKTKSVRYSTEKRSNLVVTEKKATGGIDIGLSRPDALVADEELAFALTPVKTTEAMPLSKATHAPPRQTHNYQPHDPATGSEIDRQVVAMKEKVLPRVLERIDARTAAQLSASELLQELHPVVLEIMGELKLTLNQRELERIETLLVDELLGLGPLEELLADPSVADIMVNKPDQVYVERNGKIQLTNIRFRDDEHVRHIAQRICSRVGRRVDQTTPVADARLADGSRVNVIMPPLSLRGTTISIRKFAVKPITLESMAKNGNMTLAMARFLAHATTARLNIIISGGTGSGKTTLLNALSKMIDGGERVVTIEDAAELQLQQPHVVSLEARPANLEGNGAYTIRDLLVNALRMRPDRIILGEVRGTECLDMLQAMNTGHDGSMCTLHANRPREAITRMENMVSMNGINYPLRAIRQQIVDAVDIIVQIRRMRDGVRRITSITEVVGMDDDTVVTQELFSFQYENEMHNGQISGSFVKHGVKPYSLDKFRQQGLERAVMESLA